MDTNIRNLVIGATYEFPTTVYTELPDTRTWLQKKLGKSAPGPRRETKLVRAKLVSVHEEGMQHNGGYKLRFDNGSHMSIEYGDESIPIAKRIAGGRKTRSRRRLPRKTRRRRNQ